MTLDRHSISNPTPLIVTTDMAQKPKSANIGGRRPRAQTQTSRTEHRTSGVDEDGEWEVCDIGGQHALQSLMNAYKRHSPLEEGRITNRRMMRIAVRSSPLER